MIIRQYPERIVKTSKLRLLYCEACQHREEFMVRIISKEKNTIKRTHNNGMETERAITEEKVFWMCIPHFNLAMPDFFRREKNSFVSPERIIVIRNAIEQLNYEDKDLRNFLSGFMNFRAYFCNNIIQPVKEVKDLLSIQAEELIAILKDQGYNPNKKMAGTR